MGTRPKPTATSGDAALRAVPFAALRQEYNERVKRLTALQEKRSSLQAQLDAVTRTIAAETGGRPAATAVTRQSKAKRAAAAAVASMRANHGRSFETFVVEYLGGLPMPSAATAAQIVAGVRKSGYQSVQPDTALRHALGRLALRGRLTRNADQFVLPTGPIRPAAQKEAARS